MKDSLIENYLVVVGVGRNGSTILPFLLDGSESLAVYPVEFNFLSVYSSIKKTGKIGENVWKMPTIDLDLDVSGTVHSEPIRQYLCWQWQQLVDFATLNGWEKPIPNVKDFWNAVSSEEPSCCKQWVDRYFNYFLKVFEYKQKTLLFKTIEVGMTHAYSSVFQNHKELHLIRDPFENYASLKRTHLLKKKVPNSFLGGDDLKTFLELRWLPHVRDLEKLQGENHAIRRTIVRYEDLIRDSDGMMHEICRFFNLKHGDVYLGQSTLNGKELKTSPALSETSGNFPKKAQKIWHKNSVLNPIERVIIRSSTGRYLYLWSMNSLWNIKYFSLSLPKLLLPEKDEFRNMDFRSRFGFYLHRRSLGFSIRKKTREFRKNNEKAPLLIQASRWPKWMTAKKEAARSSKYAVVVWADHLPEYSLGWIRVLELAGFQCKVVYMGANRSILDWLYQCGIDVIQLNGSPWLSGILRMPPAPESYHEFINNNVVATAMRKLRKPFEWASSDELDHVKQESRLSSSFSFYQAETFFEEVKPKLMIFNDRVYTPYAELFQAALHHKTKCLTYNSSQDGGRILLKMYQNPSEVYLHPHSLSEASWGEVSRIPFDERFRKELRNYLLQMYSSGDWFSEVGTQFHKKLLNRTELSESLGIDPSKKTAVVFSHIFWDGTVSYGCDLFDNYYDWFRNVCMVAAENTSVNWVFKVHPANLTKACREGRHYDNQEVEVMKSVFGTTPDHVKLVPSDSPICTYSFFDLMDYCLTVRGTIGIESAAMGIRTLTAGTGRYDKKGFTLDFDDKEKYLLCLQRLEQVEPMEKEETQLAVLFAYHVFLKRDIAFPGIRVSVTHNDQASHSYDFVDRKDFKREATEFIEKITPLLDDETSDYIEGI